MATTRTTDPDVGALVETIRTSAWARCPDCAQRLIAILAEITVVVRDGRAARCWAHPPVGTPAPTPESTTTPEDTLREAGIGSERQARYQRRMSSLLAGRA